MAIIAWIVKSKDYFLILLVASLLANCSIAQKPLKIKDNMVEYAESLFIRQNQATQQIILVEEDAGVAEREMLSEAELQMYSACRLLNEAASREMEGKKVSLYFRGLVKNSLDACDNSIKNMEFILNTLLE